jgi:hypothetical protein
MRKLRFSLRALLLMATAVILLVGLSQHRRREMLMAAKELQDYGYFFVDVPNATRDRLWQRQPTLGAMFYEQNRKILLLDLKNEGERGKTIENLRILGLTPAEIRAFSAEEQQAWRLQLKQKGGYTVPPMLSR